MKRLQAVSFKLEKSVIKKLDKRAIDLGMSRSALLRFWTVEELGYPLWMQKIFIRLIGKQ